jgi:hypothetical protein
MLIFLREKYCWLVARGWFVLIEKYCWLVDDKPSEQAARQDLYNFLVFKLFAVHVVYSFKKFHQLPVSRHINLQALTRSVKCGLTTKLIPQLLP